MTAELVSKITDTEKKEKAELLVAKFNDHEVLLKKFLEELNEDYTLGVRLKIINAAVKQGGIRFHTDAARKNMILDHFVSTKRGKGMFDSILSSFEFLARTDLDEDDVLVRRLSEIIENQSDRKEYILNERETRDLVRRLSCGGTLLCKLLAARIREGKLDFEFTSAWSDLLKPLLGVRSAGEGLKASDAESIITSLLSLKIEDMPDEAFLALPRLAELGGNSAVTKLLRSHFSDYWKGVVSESTAATNDTLGDLVDIEPLTPGQRGLITAIRQEFTRMTDELTDAVQQKEEARLNYNLLNDRKNKRESEFLKTESELTGHIRKLNLDLSDLVSKLDAAEHDTKASMVRADLLTKELEQIHHQSAFSETIDAHEERNEMYSKVEKPIGSIRGHLVSSLKKYPEIKTLNAIAAEFERLVDRLEKKFKIELGERIDRSLYLGKKE
jgi:hypothetical protein